MSKTLSDADVIAGGDPRHTVTLADGRRLELSYGMRSLSVLERRYGSLAAMAMLQATGTSGPVVDLTCEVVSAGLLHHDGGAHTADALLDELDSRLFTDYLDTAMEALGDALPEPEPGEAAGPTPAAPNREARSSRGAAGGTPQRSRSGAAKSSGGP